MMAKRDLRETDRGEGRTGAEEAVALPPRLACPCPSLVMLAALAAIAVVGALDYLSGAEMSVAPFYLAPIALGAWFVGRRAALLFSALSAAVRLQDLWLTTHHYAHPFTPYWNAAIELGVFMLVATLVARLRSTTEHWMALARTDALTGALNRRAFVDAATREVVRAERFRRPLSLAFLDIDDFKQVNDRGGHEHGDALLAAVARTLREHLRSFDLVARYGGDEFVVMLPETDDDAASKVLDKLMVALRTTLPGQWPTSVSMGAITVDGPRTTLARLLERADHLLYLAKHEGKNCVRHRHLHRDGTGWLQNTPVPATRVPLPALLAASQPTNSYAAAGPPRPRS
jgi:diguanylate cyclase (GGDEF)-like protein